jgi:hypothetical protein
MPQRRREATGSLVDASGCHGIANLGLSPFILIHSCAPNLKPRTIAQGVGSRENLVGNGKDDLSDSLDRRVVFNVISC